MKFMSSKFLKCFSIAKIKRIKYKSVSIKLFFRDALVILKYKISDNTKHNSLELCWGIIEVLFICFYYVYFSSLYMLYIFFIIKGFYNKLKKTDNMSLYKYTLPAYKRPLLLWWRSY